MLRKLFSTVSALMFLALSLLSAQAQPQAGAYPSKPIRLIVPFPPGGGTDILSRLVANKLTETSKWTVIPDNRGGAGGTIGIAEAARAAPTGYEMVMGQKDNLVVAPWLYKNLSYDPTRDLVAVAHVAYTPVVIVTSATSRFKSLADVVAAAKAAPDSVTYGSPGNGTTIHLAGEIFNTAAGIKLRHIPYKGSNPAMMDVLAGNVDLMVSSLPSAIGQIKSGKLRALAVTSLHRSTSLPDVPTVAELGYKAFHAGRHACGHRRHDECRGQQAAGRRGHESGHQRPGRRSADHDAAAIFQPAEDRLPEMEGHCAGIRRHHRIARCGTGQLQACCRP
jgi:tripartite-type tricarboxylate transporter receptor subunit TctC